MPLRTVRNQSLGDQVFEQLGREIVLGHFAPGEHLPPERTLVETFGVNRHVVREALKRLEQMGLIRGAQGDGTLVLDFKKTAGLDLLALMAEQAQAGFPSRRTGLKPGARRSSFRNRLFATPCTAAAR